MRQAAMLRFLELVCKELGAVDARAEVGGRDPDDPRLVWLNAAAGFRLVTVFEAAPSDADAKREKLEELVAGFANTLRESVVPLAPVPPVDVAVRRLDDALEVLRSRSGATSVVIVDVQSPVLWGASDPQRHAADVDALVQVGDTMQAILDAGTSLDGLCAKRSEALLGRLRGLGPNALGALDYVLGQADEATLRHSLLTCQAIARTRREAALPHAPSRFVHHGEQFGYFVRTFANIYLLVIVFEGAFSELSVESAVVHALPTIEQLLLALPPLDPGPAAKRGRVIPLRR